MSKTLIIFSLLFLLLLFGCKNENSEFIRTSSTLPFFSTEKWRELNYSSDEFAVEIQNGELTISRAEYRNTSELELTDGKLIGYNMGEWGGSLRFVSNEASSDTIEIKQGNIEHICNFNDELFFFEGIAHMDYNAGALFKLTREGNDFSYEEVLSFDDAPSAFAITDNKMYVATYSGFSTIDAKLKKKTFYKEMFWGGLYPNSVAILGNKAYVGIRSGYLEINLITRWFTFYKYNTEYSLNSQEL